MTKKNNISPIVFLLMGGIVLRIILVLFTPELGDVKNFHAVGEIFLKQHEVYRGMVGLNPYPPVWIFIEGFLAWFSHVTHVPFIYLEKLPIFLADIVIMLLLYQNLKIKSAILLYVFNPVIIYTGVVLGQFDPIVILLLLLSYRFFAQKDMLFRSAILLSAAICLKTYPVLLLPLFLFSLKTVKQRVIFITIAVVPYLILVLPFIFADFSSIYQTYLSYGGAVDYGWSGSIKAIVALITDTSINLTPLTKFLPILLQLSKYPFVLAYLFLLYKLATKRSHLLTGIILTLLLFYILYGGVGSQYFFWIVPFLLIYNVKTTARYMFYSSGALIAYLGAQFYEPFFKHLPFIIFKSPFIVNAVYLIFLVIFWIFLIEVFMQITKKEFKTNS